MHSDHKTAQSLSSSNRKAVTMGTNTEKTACTKLKNHIKTFVAVGVSLAVWISVPCLHEEVGS